MIFDPTTLADHNRLRTMLTVRSRMLWSIIRADIKNHGTRMGRIAYLLERLEQIGLNDSIPATNLRMSGMVMVPAEWNTVIANEDRSPDPWKHEHIRAYLTMVADIRRVEQNLEEQMEMSCWPPIDLDRMGKIYQEAVKYELHRTKIGTLIQAKIRKLKGTKL
jgi:hypothetical protein